mgnify:CR=1 FL=1
MFHKALRLLIISMILTGTACGSEENRTVRGLVTTVQPRSITEVATFAVEEANTGKLWVFQTEGSIGFTPSHIRDHMIQGQMVTVYYNEHNGVFTAVLATD